MKFTKTIAALIFILSALSLGAQVQEAGYIATPSTTTSILGQAQVAMTNATCNVVTPGSNCTVSGLSTSYLAAYVQTYYLTGSLSSPQTLVVPLQPGAFHCIGNSTGQTITVGGVSGATVAIPNGLTQCISSYDGVNYVGVANNFVGTGVVQVSSGVTSVNTALANGTTATTQTVGDTTAKVATDAFVANAVAGSSSGTNVIYASSLGCPTPGVDMTAGLMPNGTTPTSATTCLSNSLNGANPATNPITLVLDNSYYGAIFGPAAGGWKIVSAHKSGVGREPITAWNCTAGTPVSCVFTVSGNQLAVNQYVVMGLFSTTSFNSSLVFWHVTAVSTNSFTANAPTGFATTGTGTETAAEANWLFGDGLFAPQGLNNDVIHNGLSSQPGLCFNSSGTLYSDPGWINPGPAPARGSGIEIDGIAINGNRGNGTIGNSTSGIPQGTALYTGLYVPPFGTGQAYCSYMGININNIDNIIIDGVTIYNPPAYMTRFTNDSNVKVVHATMNAVFPNGPTTSHTSGLNGDGIHINGPGEHFYFDDINFICTDDCLAANAPEGYVGVIRDVNMSNSTYHNSLNAVRIYTGSIAPPTGDATPQVIGVHLNQYSGDTTQTCAFWGLAIGSPRTFTVADSMTDISWSDSTCSGAALGMVADDTIGTIRFNNLYLKDITGANGATGFFSNWNGTEPITSLEISASKAIYTTANHSLNSMVYGGGGSIQITDLTVNGFGVVNETGSNTMAQLLNLPNSSSISNFKGQETVDYSNIALATASGQSTKVTTWRGRQFTTVSGDGVSGLFPVDSITETQGAMTSFTCPYHSVSSNTINTFNFSLNRDCVHGTFSNTARSGMYIQLGDGDGSTSPSHMVIATALAANTTPAFRVWFGQGVVEGSAILGNGSAPVVETADPGDGNHRIAGTYGFGNNSGTRVGFVGPCPWAATYSCVDLNNNSTAASNIGISGGDTSGVDKTLYFNVPTGGENILQVNAVGDFGVKANLAEQPSTGVLGWDVGVLTTTCDTGISRDSAGVIDFGNCTAGNKSGTINATTANFTGVLTVGSCTGCGSGTPAFSTLSSGTNTTMAANCSTGCSMTGNINALTVASKGLTGVGTQIPTISATVVTNSLTKYLDSAGTIGDSSLVDNGTTVTVPEPTTISVNGAASTPAGQFTGTWFSGGTGTTTTPQVLVAPSGSSTSNWSTSGTGVGVVCPSTSGNSFDGQASGISIMAVGCDGMIRIHGGSTLTNLAVNVGTTATGDMFISHSNMGGNPATTLFISTATSTLTNSTAATSIVPTGSGTMTFPSFYWIGTRKVRLDIGGVYSTTTVPGNLTVNVTFGGTTIATSTITNLLGSATTQRFTVSLNIMCPVAVSNLCGAYIDGGAMYSLGLGIARGNVDLSNNGNTFSMATNVSNLLDVTAQWATASTSNTITTTSVTLTELQ